MGLLCRRPPVVGIRTGAGRFRRVSHGAGSAGGWPALMAQATASGLLHLDGDVGQFVDGAQQGLVV
ncbi:MAG: hypothetical protein B7Z30_01995, partial [Rhizobiales bacterium 12-68-15]